VFLVYGEGAPRPKGTVMTGTFEIEGQQFIASMADLTSLFRRRCHSSLAAKHRQKWTACGEKLLAGGEVQQCGWLKDSFGVS